jgi:hypothetical protein
VSAGKVILCRCEDVTLSDVVHSLELGYLDIEEVKRYTGFGTGPCQGKECHALVAATIAERTGLDPQAIIPFTSRSPISPTPLGVLAAAGSRSRVGAWSETAPDEDEGP